MHEKTHIEADGIKIWLDSGILYIEYSKKVSLGLFMETQTLGLDLLKQNGLTITPLIIIYEGEAKDAIEFSTPDIGKLFSSVDVFNHVSRIWIVNAGEAHQRIGGMINKFFLNGQMSFVDSLEAAQTEAKEFLAEEARLHKGNTP